MQELTNPLTLHPPGLLHDTHRAPLCSAPVRAIFCRTLQAEEAEVKKAKKRGRTRVVRDEHGNPIDIRL